ncbi:glycosyltransferase family 9 protein [bacterium]|nr:glycosyltransferase family 9 protein [bacterium]
MKIPEVSKVRSILVVKLRALGDVLTTYPLLRALKEYYPQARLSMMADDSYQDILETNPRIDALRLHPASQLRQAGQGDALRQQWQAIRAIRQEKYDLYIDLYGSLRTALWGYLGKIPYRMGFDLRGRKYFYNHTIQAKYRYVVDLNLQFAQALGWEKKSNQLEFYTTPQDEVRAHEHLKRQHWNAAKPYMVVSPGGGWPLKQWGAKRFGRVAKAMADKTGCQIVLSGSQAETLLIQTCGAAADIPVINAVGLPLRQVAAIIKGSRLFLGNDSGPKYFAEAFGVPTLICYGPTDYVNNNPQRPQNQVACFQTECRPCHSEICRMPSRDCMNRISEDEVAARALKLWEKNG